MLIRPVDVAPMLQGSYWRAGTGCSGPSPGEVPVALRATNTMRGSHTRSDAKNRTLSYACLHAPRVGVWHRVV